MSVILKALIVFIIFFVSASAAIYIDGVCFETTGYGGILSSFD